MSIHKLVVIRAVIVASGKNDRSMNSDPGRTFTPVDLTEHAIAAILGDGD
jgi:hypothetical protein